jgi:hypothetical protein
MLFPRCLFVNFIVDSLTLTFLLLNFVLNSFMMATTTKISIKPSEVDIFEKSKIDSDAALKASQVLQENHELHHIFFTSSGLHVRPPVTHLQVFMQIHFNSEPHRSSYPHDSRSWCNTRRHRAPLPEKQIVPKTTRRKSTRHYREPFSSRHI